MDRLPIELLYSIAEHFERARDIFSLARTSRELYCHLLPLLYRFNVRHQNSSALSWFAQHGKPDAAESFIRQYNADINAVYNNDTPLIWACKAGSESVVKILTARDPLINFQNHNLESALWWAARNGYELIVDELLKKQHIQTDHADKFGITPLAAAVNSGNLNIVRSLLATGRAGINLSDRRGRTPAMLAMLSGEEDMLQTLLEHTPDIDHQGNTNSLLGFAASYNLLPAVKTLVKMGATINLTNHHGYTPLDHAMSRQNLDVAKFLLQVTTGVSTIDSRGNNRTSLSLPLATLLPDGEMVQLLLDRGYDVNARDREQRTPLHCAAMVENLDAINILLQCRDINVNAQDGDGQTPLLYAHRYKRSTATMRLVRDSRVCANIADNQGRTLFN